MLVDFLYRGEHFSTEKLILTIVVFTLAHFVGVGIEKAVCVCVLVVVCYDVGYNFKWEKLPVVPCPRCLKVRDV